MKKIFLLTVTRSLLALASCKKNDAVKRVKTTPDKLLKKLTKTKNNTVTVFNVQYDAARRLLSCKSSDNKTGIDFAYDGNGNLINAVNN